MDKNDFDVDFDFDKDMGFDPEEFLGSDDPGDFDMSQFDDDDLNLSDILGEDGGDAADFQDYNMEEEKARSEDTFDPYSDGDGTDQTAE